MGASEALSWWDPSTWGALVHGRSAILFALLAGVSLALISGRTVPPQGHELVSLRFKVIVRALCLYVIGAILASLDSRIAIILENYAVLFIVAIPFLTARRRTLVATAAAMTVIGPLITALLTAADHSIMPLGLPFSDLVATPYYPVFTWIPFILIGLAAGRTDLTRPKNVAVIGSIGLAMTIAGYATASLVGRVLFAALPAYAPNVQGYDPASMLGAEEGPTALEALRESFVYQIANMGTVEPHSGTPNEIVGSAGFALAILALCLLLCRNSVAAALTRPLRALGSMSLTVYTVHVISFRIMRDTIHEIAGFAVDQWAGSVLLLLLLTVLLKVTIGKGPLERLVGWVVRWTTTPPDSHTSAHLPGDHSPGAGRPGSHVTTSTT